ncbi:uncharacterized protein LOC135468214 isoform X2 [Liolophura sinensis]
MIRREKKDVLTQLPPKRRQRILFDLKDSDLKTDILDTFEELQSYLVKAGPDLSNASSITIDRKEKPKRRKSAKHKLIGEITFVESPEHKGNNSVIGLSGNDSADDHVMANEQNLTVNKHKSRVQKDKKTDKQEISGDPSEKRVTMLSLISKLYKLTGEAKIGPAKDYVQLLCENPSLKLLVFAYHHTMMDGIQQTLWENKVKFIRIDGNTKPSERLYFVQQFQADPDCRVAILSILAAGVGLTFTAAKLVMFAEMYWTPGVMIQCEDRAHRIGQTSCVPVHYLVAKGTMDEWVWSAVCKKTTIVTATLNGRVQSLEADEGDRYQVEVLSNAEAWVPSSHLPDMDLTSFFLSQQPANQRSIKDFLTSSQSKKKDSSLESSHHRKKGKDSKENTDVICVTLSDDEVDQRSPQLFDDGIQRGQNKRKRKCGDDEEEVTPEKHVLGYPVVGLLEQDDADSEDFSSHRSASRKKLKFTDKPKSPGFECWEENDNESGVTVSHRSEAQREKPSDWGCSVCTYLNHRSLPYCEMCETPKEQASKSQNSSQKTVEEGGRLNCDGIKQTEDLALLDSVTKDDKTSQCHVADVMNRSSSSARAVHSISSSEESDAEECIDIDLPDLLCSRRISNQSGCLGGNSEDNSSPAETIPKSCRENDSVQSYVYHRRRHKAINSSNIVHCEPDTHSPSPKEMSLTLSSGCHGDGVKGHQPCSPIETTLTSCKTSSSSTSSNHSTTLNFSFNLPEDSIMNLDSSGQSPFNSPSGTDFVSRMSKDDPQGCVLEQELRGNDLGKQSCVTLTHGESASRAQTDSVIEETKAAAVMFSPKRSVREEQEGEWLCPDCNVINPGWEEHCDGCLSSRPDHASAPSEPEAAKKRVIDLDCIPVHRSFSYCCSKHTGRIYLFDKDGQPLHVNFLPLDVSVGNVDDLPDLLLHPSNLRVVRRFVEEWNRLSETKRRFLIRHTDVFESPITAYDQLKNGTVPSVSRHLTKEAVSLAALSKAQQVEGSVRVIAPPQSRPNRPCDVGLAQVLNKDGVPLCVNCQKPYENTLLKTSTIQSAQNAWYTRFCSPDCSHTYWMKTHNDYSRGQIFDLEHGICQLCRVDAHSVFRQIRDTPELKKRAMILKDTVYSKLTARQKSSMVQNPTAGLFWHVDHIVPVWEGGGECDIDNLRTLCTPCHHRVTAEQSRQRSRARKLGDAVSCRDISSFFKPS